MREPLTEAELDELEALEREATQAPWIAEANRGWDVRAEDEDCDHLYVARDGWQGDVRLIAALRNAAPRLLREVRALRLQLAMRDAYGRGDLDELDRLREELAKR